MKKPQQTKEMIEQLLLTHNKKQLAKELRISRQSLYNYMKELGINYKSENQVYNYDLIKSGELDERVKKLLAKNL